MSANEKITLRQLQILIILCAMATGLIVLPRRVAEFLLESPQDGWVIVVGLGVLGVLVGLLLVWAAVSVMPGQVRNGGGGEYRNDSHGESPDSYSDSPIVFLKSVSSLLSKPVAYVICAVLWLKLVLSAGLETRAFLEITKETLLPRTPMPVVAVLIVATCAYCAIKGIETGARVAEVLFMVTIIPFVIIFVVALCTTDFANLRPAFVTPPGRILSGTLRLGFIFTGLECLLLVPPFVKAKGRRLGQGVGAALGFAGLLVVAITVITIAALGTRVAHEPWPVIRMLDTLNIPGSFVQRKDAITFGFWIITTFVLVQALLFFGGVLVRNINSKPGAVGGVLITAAAVLAVVCFPWKRDAIYENLDIIYMSTGVFFLVVLPLILLVAAKIRGKAALAGLVIILTVFLLTGCWDAVEIEDRAFVVAMAIDKTEEEGRGHYLVTLSIPSFSEEDDEEEKETKSATGLTLTEALKNLDAKTNKELYYYQMKTLVLGTELLEDGEMLQAVVRTLDARPEFHCNLHVIAAEEPDQLLALPSGEESLSGLFTSEIFRDKNKTGGTGFVLDYGRFSEVLRQGKHSQAGIIVPMIVVEDEDPVFCGAAIIEAGNKNARISNDKKSSPLEKCHLPKKTGILTQDELRGYLWCIPGGCKGAIVTVDDDNPFSVKVVRHKARIRFEEASAAPLRAVLDIQVAGEIGECAAAPRKDDKIVNAIEEKISDEIRDTIDLLQDKHSTDGYGLLEQLRKENYPLYRRYADDWQDVFPVIEIVPCVRVRVVD